jgi:hypothetical protein
VIIIFDWHNTPRYFVDVAVKEPSCGVPVMRLDYEISVTCKDGSRANVHVYGQPAPHPDDIVVLPLDGKMIRAKIDTPQTIAAEAVAHEI